ncbi:MAG: NAD+ synthase [Balneolaceae bacterium]
MRVRIEQLNPTIGDVDKNLNLILNSLASAESGDVDLLILPEMVLTGYPAQDLLEKLAFREYCYRANEKIIEKTGDTALLFGTLTPNRQDTGRKMFNSAILAHRGKMIGQTNKTLLPTYDIFDDFRYFEPNRKFKCMEFKGVKLGVTICEDIWYNENEVQYHVYDVSPAARLRDQGAQVIINISASPFTKSKHRNRLQMLKNHAAQLDLPLFYSNQVGAHTEVIFDGDSLALDSRGNLIATTEPYKEDYTDVDWNPAQGSLECIGVEKNTVEDKQARILGAIRLGLGDYLRKTGISRKVVVGLSGGIDSALTVVLAVAAIGAENVVALNMPSEFSSRGSRDHSAQLAENLGIELHNIEIKTLYRDYLDALAPLFKGTEFGVAEENIQSRIRGSLLMAYSNKFGNMLLATGNKSELAVGYATLYGDMNGGLNLIGDLYKNEVFELAYWLNDTYYQKEVIPKPILEKPPSAELRPDQKDTDSLPEYAILDQILWRYIDLQQELKQIVEAGYEEEIVRETIRMVDLNEFKRFQAPPILKLSPKSFGTGRRWPMVQNWTYHEMSKKES